MRNPSLRPPPRYSRSRMGEGSHTLDLDRTVAAPGDRSADSASRPDDATVPFAAPEETRARAAGPQPPVVAGYEIVRLLGQGGMGVVWEALDHRLGRTVALKVHADVDGAAAEALWIEARMAAMIAHPGIVPIHEVGHTASGEPYYTMDLVEGTSLRALVREGPIAPRRALSIARLIAEAIGVAHARGVVHCDLKPGNVIVDADGRARILDFGLAFATSGAGGATFQPMRGSLPYMSPEQIAGEPLTAATDVYSLGVVLHEMLTAQLPFRGASTEEMLAAITLTEPDPPSRRSAAVPAELDRLCLACLDKRASRRPADGRALAREIGRILEGDARGEPDEAAPYVPRRISSRPAPPPLEAPDGTQTYRFELRLASPASRLWPLVSNTDRLNRAVGLPSVAFTELPSASGAARKAGRFRVLGMDIAWEENPFEWVHEREHRVLRRYTRGPLAWLANHVSLSPRADGGTDLVHEIQAAPRGALGKVSAFWEIRWKLGRKLDAAYRRMDAAASRPAEVEVDPFEPPHEPTPQQAAHVANGVDRLATLSERRFPRDLLERLRALLLHAPEKRIERMRPHALADAWGSPRAEVLDLFLHAANAGLVDIAWDLVCPGCYVAHEVSPRLRDIAQQGSCGACGDTYTRDLAGSVELIFRPHREVRDIATAVYCTGSPAMRSHVLAQQVLSPRERRTVVLSLPRADILARVERRPLSAEVSSSPAGLSPSCEVRVSDGRVDVTPAIVRAGDVEVTLVNDTAEHHVVRLERPPQKADSVTAAAAMTHPTFQAFFSDELLREGEHLRVSHLAFVAVDLESRARVLRELGDPAAFARFSWLSERILSVADEQQGAVFRAGFELTLAAFSGAAAAVRAAIAIAKVAREAEAPLGVRVAVHAGRCIAVSRGARTDYFGETLERVVALLGDANAGVVAVSSAVDDEPAALRAMLSPGVERRVVSSRAGDYGGRRVTRLSFG